MVKIKQSNTPFIISKEKSLEFKKRFESKIIDEDFKKRCIEIYALSGRDTRYYHGTSDALQINKEILPPISTGIKREGLRKKFVDKVFFTNSLKSANMYAKKSCEKHGGSPIVYLVKPIGNVWNVNGAEYVADKALVLKELDKGRR